MIMTTEGQLRKIAKKLKDGNARIVGVAKENDNLYYAIDDLEDQKTHHVPVWKRPSWSKKISKAG